MDFTGILNEIKSLVDQFVSDLKITYIDTPFDDIFSKQNFAWDFSAYEWLYTLLNAFLIIIGVILLVNFFKFIFKKVGSII